MTQTRAETQLLLALETSGDVCGVALLRDGMLLFERTLRHEMHLSEHLMNQIDGVLHDAGAALSMVAAFGVGIGPGSFTGTRIGVMTIKTLASVLSRPVYGIDGLAALAGEYCGLTDLIVVPMQPCRTGIVYTGAFDVSGDQPTPLWPSDALSIEELAPRLSLNGLPTTASQSCRAIERPVERLLFCGSAATRYRDTLEGYLGQDCALSFGIAAFPRASAVGSLAWRRHIAGDADDVLALTPRYISPPPITLPRQPIPQSDRLDE